MEARINSVKVLRYRWKKYMTHYMESLAVTLFLLIAKIKLKRLENNWKVCSFIVSLVVWYEILFHFNKIIKMMQATDSDLKMAAEYYRVIVRKGKWIIMYEYWYLVFLFDVLSLQEANFSELKKNCLDLQNTFGGHSDIDGKDFFSELQMFSTVLPSNWTPFHIFEGFWMYRICVCICELEKMCQLLLPQGSEFVKAY